MPVVTLLTDFGTPDAFPGIMKGVILGICPEARVVDLTHDIPPQQVLAGALVLRSAVPFFPAGTIHVAVVDPGVGSARRALVIATERGLLVGPDNGVLSLAAAALGMRRAYHATNAAQFLPAVSHTFHGRDVFAPLAAHLARGAAPHTCGPVVDTIVEVALPPVQRTAGRIAGEVIHVDRFGNLVTNIDAAALAAFSGRALSVSIGAVRIPGLVEAYAAVAPGTPLAVAGSWGLMEIAVRDGNAAQVLSVARGATVTVTAEASHR